ncbi:MULTISPECIES: 50S ribosomal protein L29 [unclassified Nitratiruptor]|uniref:Large ribosomal subunit protein uL29 n=1 Tax=Nitratiruptor sp. (strain SB155-2) TaxID=387092 RepID=RL29_NITSB|nr:MULTISPECIES: 50S ribosomal protein L29 [unclassified Nitratiruptor]A6Q1I6.1 RecName: Full=Large ribosomal subunit protein uL29; AltName: Full=50S ribosomal protein L29 [Nitratiruptor sp. SB155-2]BAF69345.1 50S ribosomal protein L29 [Nitratiruptor sp. SB155-2]BCD59500.1 large subunit ribosomal protein L29 [Nitratiruptor sp. YY08-10]BCD63424.1 large subunit ribosomal protein L29 [Nitratiruptor sp. YY08-14]
MKYTEIKEKSLQELEGLLKEKKLELFGLRMKLKTMQLQDTSAIRKTRKDIARIKTAIAEKRRAG